MKKLTDVISLKQVGNPQMQYHIYISTKRDIELEGRIDLAEKDKEEQIQTELIEFLENQDNENEFILVGNQAVKVNEIIYVKVLWFLRKDIIHKEYHIFKKAPILGAFFVI
ncbi:hypothetical protein Q8G37_15995 [Bacillus wiedmannii]|uniref:hypothetical protein n=1 Tax=Bacillus wiedmannii TaxID=1890302 RepID=UPI0027314910|nr:hypothetical protein [Bacillus wiedmannii]MDP1457947.1 hypothetical protein [Bacillus wiedmannii]